VSLIIIRRNIRSFFDFGVRPVSCKAPTSPRPDVYLLSHILECGKYDTDVVFQTSFSASGWGRRALSLTELGKAHGFPRAIAMHSSMHASMLDWPPIQLLDALLFGLSDTIQHSSSPNVDFVDTPMVPSSAPPLAPLPSLQRSWIPELGRFLDHKWIDQSLITIKAIKHDNAAAPSHLWDARLTGLFPGIGPHLLLLGTHMLRRYRRQLWREARGYLQCSYGSHWVSQLHHRDTSHDLVGRKRPLLRGDTDQESVGETQVQRLVEDMEAIRLLLTQHPSAPGGTGMVGQV
jgi:hypothetical protein